MLQDLVNTGVKINTRKFFKDAEKPFLTLLLRSYGASGVFVFFVKIFREGVNLIVRIIGRETTDFIAKDGQRISGTTFHTAETISSQRGEGEKGDRFFLSAAKLAALDFVPAVNQTVEIYYNRFGKVATLRLVDDIIID